MVRETSFLLIVLCDVNCVGSNFFPPHLSSTTEIEIPKDMIPIDQEDEFNEDASPLFDDDDDKWTDLGMEYTSGDN
jgi:hypothetical protein